MNITTLFILTLVSVVQLACASHRVIRDRDYEVAVNAYRGGHTELAQAKFPKGEDGGLITSIEKSWLSIWNNQYDPKALQAQVATFDERKYTSVSREAGYFLFQEAEEGYVPSEHEIVLLHLLSAIHFMQTDHTEDALVELRRAGYVLDRYWDDPSLRLWLGSLWAAAGHWDEAQVDFRQAEKLSPNIELRRLLKGPPPKQLFLHFAGTAPVLRWEEGHYVPTFLPENSEPTSLPISASTFPWFERHQQRNTQLRDVLVKSNFMAQYLGGKALTGAETGINKVGTWTIRIAGVIVGLAITGGVIYVLGQLPAGTGSEGLGYLLAIGLGAGTAIWAHGEQLDHELQRATDLNDQVKQEDLRIYRMVRFLPGWIGLSLDAIGEGTNVVLKSDSSRTRVTLINHF